MAALRMRSMAVRRNSVYETQLSPSTVKILTRDHSRTSVLHAGKQAACCTLGNRPRVNSYLTAATIRSKSEILHTQFHLMGKPEAHLSPPAESFRNPHVETLLSGLLTLRYRTAIAWVTASPPAPAAARWNIVR